MAAEMNEQKILALPRTERRMQLSFKEEEEEEEEEGSGIFIASSCSGMRFVRE